MYFAEQALTCTQTDVSSALSSLHSGNVKKANALACMNSAAQGLAHTHFLRVVEFISQLLISVSVVCRRQPHNRKALQKVFGGSEPKLIGFAAKVLQTPVAQHTQFSYFVS